MLTALTVPAFDRLFESVIDEMSGPRFAKLGTNGVYSPAIDVLENADAIVFHCDVPGFKSEDLEIELASGVLTIKGRRRHEGNGDERLLAGRRYGAFVRSFTLPEIADGERMTARLADGVLSIHVPKHAKAKARRIPIESSTEPPKLEA
ncbi:MAG TPA: Hsp20/alpha crystallin family protein [Vulgatibacter sp.]